MSPFTFSTPSSGFLIPVPSGWKPTSFTATECMIEKLNGEAVRFRIETVTPFNNLPPFERLNRYCTRWEVSEWTANGVSRIMRRGYRRRTDGVLEWLVNQK